MLSYDQASAIALIIGLVWAGIVAREIERENPTVMLWAIPSIVIVCFALGSLVQP